MSILYNYEELISQEYRVKGEWMKITWYGTATLRLESEQGRVLIDPFLRRYGNMERLTTTFARENVVFITHGHFDHISNMYHIFGRRNNLRIYATKTPIKTLIADGMEPEVFHEISCGDSLEINGFHVSVWKGSHIRFDNTLVRHTIFSKRMLTYFFDFLKDIARWTHYRETGETVFFEFAAEGKRIQVIGSAAVAEGISYPTGADLLALSYQGRSDIASYIQTIIEQLQPKCIMPIHFDDSFPPISSEVDMGDFERMMRDRFPRIGLMIPQLDVTYEI